MSVCDLLTRPRFSAPYTPCGKPAVAFIAAPDGSGGMYACGGHCGHVIILVASRTDLTGPLQYTPLGTHADAIERARTQDKEPRL